MRKLIEFEISAADGTWLYEARIISLNIILNLPIYFTPLLHPQIP